mmetsp:Transcript_56421/g.123279  ORF Transcript_56421/g.123279 Transcript_56421/m.123279 type:complete len:498 (+) Transcript_56421:60-1553(+)
MAAVEKPTQGDLSSLEEGETATSTTKDGGESSSPLSLHFNLQEDGLQDSKESLDGRQSSSEENGPDHDRHRKGVAALVQMFESIPEKNKAEAAARLRGLTFDAPPVEQWRAQQGEEDEVEDRRAEFFARDLERRGTLPRHLASAEDSKQIESLWESLNELRQSLASEKAQVQSIKEGLEAKERGLLRQQAQLHEEHATRSFKKLQDEGYPRPGWLLHIEGTINVGIVGNSGVGKSLLINRLRDVSPGARGWAPVGVSETTHQVSMYAFPNERRVRLWDFPGAGTLAFPKDTYIARMGLRYLDKVIIVTAGRFTETEVDIMKELRLFNIPHVMVRTKLDIDIWNNRMDNGCTDEQTIQQIRHDLATNHVQHAYLVSLRDTSSFDFPDLLREVFPCLHQQEMGNAWDDPWSLPQSKVVTGLQGRWTDGSCVYTVKGLQVHVACGDQCAVVDLQENEDKVWFNGLLWVSEATVAMAASSDLWWTPVDGEVVGPVAWRWCG